jgi:hypothetical protein
MRLKILLKTILRCKNLHSNKNKKQEKNKIKNHPPSLHLLIKKVEIKEKEDFKQNQKLFNSTCLY